MNGRLISALIAGAAVGAAAMPVFAITCYEVIDRNNVVILRGTRPPVDLSNAGAPAREAMRGRGELLVIFSSENCVLVGRAARGWRQDAHHRRDRRRVEANAVREEERLGNVFGALRRPAAAGADSDRDAVAVSDAPGRPRARAHPLCR